MTRLLRQESGFVATRNRGTVIIPAHNEASTIARPLRHLSSAAAAGQIDVIVVCNGCTDDTATVARQFSGVRVLEVWQASKSAALNEGDRAATTWPRLYLDADIECTVDAALSVFDVLATGSHLAARPTARYETTDASWLVGRYYRARERMGVLDGNLWGAGAYAMSETGHQRFDHFPDITGDDLFVDAQFALAEKLVVATEPVVVTTPRQVRGLVAVLRRASSGNSAFFSSEHGKNACASDTTKTTAKKLLHTIHGPGSAIDALVYGSFAILSRLRRREAQSEWLRDESSRLAAFEDRSKSSLEHAVHSPDTSTTLLPGAHQSLLRVANQSALRPPSPPVDKQCRANGKSDT